jgi:hypothetical protein
MVTRSKSKSKTRPKTKTRPRRINVRVETVAYNCIERIKELEQELMRARLEAKKDKEWNQDTGKYYIEDLKEKIKEFEYVLGITKTKPKGKLFPKCPVWRFQ